MDFTFLLFDSIPHLESKKKIFENKIFIVPSFTQRVKIRVFFKKEIIQFAFRKTRKKSPRSSSKQISRQIEES